MRTSQLCGTSSRTANRRSGTFRAAPAQQQVMRTNTQQARKRVRAAPRITLPAASPRAILRAPPLGAMALALAGWTQSSASGGLLHMTREEASCRATAKLAGQRHVGWPVWLAGGRA